MSEKNGLDMLSQEIEIPEVVNQKAEEAFARIRKESVRGARKEQEPGRKVVRRRRTRKTAAAIILVAVMALGTLTVAIAATNPRLSAGIRAYLGITDEQEQELIEKNDPVLDLVEERNTDRQAEDSGEGQVAASQTEEQNGEKETTAEVISATDQGVTITVEQTMADEYTVMIAFRIEGADFDPETETPPSFSLMGITIDGCKAGSSGGTMVLREDGSVEYDVTMRMRVGEGEDFAPGEFIGKEVRVSIDKLRIHGTGKESNAERIIEGSWNLTWTLSGTENNRTVELQESIGETGAVVTEVHISPLSIRVTYDFPYEEYLEGTITDSEGNLREVWSRTEPPALYGFILADGTVYTRGDGYLESGEGLRWTQDDPDTAYQVTPVRTILDPEQVAGLLFQDSTGVTHEGELGTIITVMFEE